MGELGNPSSLHGSGRRARRRIEESREQLAAALGARPVRGRVHRRRHRGGQPRRQGHLLGPPRRRPAPPPRPRQRDRAPRRHRLGRVARRRTKAPRSPGCPSTRAGSVDPDVAARSARPRTRTSVALVSVMWANNEVGTVQPIAELAAVAHEFGVPLHTDAVQAVGSVPVDFARVRCRRADHDRAQARRPVGAGALLLRRDVDCVPLAARRRSGARRALGHARRARRCGSRRGDRPRRRAAARHARPRRGAARRARRRRPRAGPRRRSSTAIPAQRLPGIAHLSFPGCEGDSLLMLLDARGVECSTGSACSAGVAQPSHVLLAMGPSAERRARFAAVLARAHLHRGRRRRRRSTRSARPSSGRAGPASPRAS